MPNTKAEKRLILRMTRLVRSGKFKLKSGATFDSRRPKEPFTGCVMGCAIVAASPKLEDYDRHMRGDLPAASGVHLSFLSAMEEAFECGARTTRQEAPGRTWLDGILVPKPSQAAHVRGARAGLRFRKMMWRLEANE